MLFNGLAFWVFLPIFLLFYSALRGQARLWLCLAGSYVFYGWWDWRFLFLIGFMTLVNFFIGLRMEASTDQRHRKHLLWASAATSLLVLGFFKYANFFVDSFSAMTGIGDGVMLSIILPVGISFYTFQTMSYTIDLYRGDVQVERSLLRFATFVAFFPQLVAGPIVRAADFLPQLYEDQKMTWERFLSGATLVAWGLFLKCVLADSLAVVVDRCFENLLGASPSFMSLSMIFYAFQIYGDFCGYSLIAIGLARVMGFEFLQNFNRPYFAVSFSDFWQRWHISLSSWLRDYLYIPLGGNRSGKVRTYINLFLTMLLGGLWHGAAWTFVIWGALHGSYLIGQRLLTPHYEKCCQVLRLPKGPRWCIQVAAVFACTLVAWVFFRAQGFDEAFMILGKMVDFGNYDLGSIKYKFLSMKGVALIAFVFLAEWLSFRMDFNQLANRIPHLRFVFILTMLLSLGFLGTFGNNAFIYFQF